MNEKYLPIGTVCTLKGKNKKVMVTGFYSVEFNGNLKINDYFGCVYPEGMLKPEAMGTFNHSDIEKVDFIGYINEEQEKFKKLLNKLTNNTDESKNEDWVLASNEAYSKILFDENGVVVLAEPAPEVNKKDEIRFDKNGFVVSVETNKQNNPFYQNYDSVEQSKEVSNSIINNNLDDKIDSKMFEEQKKSLNKIEFDENGFVVSVKEEKSMNQYKFDENGILISIGEEKIEDDVPPIGPGLPGYVEPVPPIGPGLPGYVAPKQEQSNYKFDENGVVVEVN